MTAPMANAALLKLLNDPESDTLSLDDISKLLEAPWERDAMLRAAVPTRFDHATVIDVLQPSIPGAPNADELFAWFAKQGNIETGDEAQPTLSVRQAFRHDLLVRERGRLENEADVAKLRAFAATLAHYFAMRDAEWDLDAASVLVVGDPDRAWTQIGRLYRMAERRADFTRCFQILQVVEERRNFAQALSAGAHQWAGDYRKFLGNIGELRRRYDAARTFATDFERTSQVLERDVMLEAWRWISRRPRKTVTATHALPTRKAAPVRRTREQWILNIEAQGGVGKTMFLRWLSARKCIRQHIPYARLDFDFVDARLTSVAPWYLIAQCARILDPQLAGRPLSGVVARAEDLVPYDTFALGPQEISRALGQLGSDVAKEFGAAAIDEIARALNRSKAHAVVIVLDTLEQAMLSSDADLLALFAVLQQLHDQCPKLKVVLSGRYSLAARVPEFERDFSAQCRTIKLAPLSLEESRAYLVHTRGMPKSAVVSAIARKSGGLAFALSLFADEWEANRKLTVRDVERFEGPELHYLVERVLKRVPVQIAWLLRYGVAARRLNKAFLSDVILPELEEFRRGARHDNPLLDSRVVAQYYDATKLALGQQVLSADLLWADLERYASAFSFVSRDPTQPNCLVIHAEVLTPLRREMQKHSVVRRLHRRAMTLADSRAGILDASNESTWTAERAEALYHALRISEKEGRRSWNAALAATSRHRAFGARASLASEALDEAAPVGVPFRVEAAQTRTEALIALAQTRFKDAATDWDNAAKAFKLWSTLQTSVENRRSAQLQIARVRITSRTGTPAPAALRTLSATLARTRRTVDKLDLLAALVEGNSYRPAAVRHIAAARALLAKPAHGWSLSNTQKFRMAACMELMRQGDYDLALELVQEVVANMRDMSLSARLNAYLMQANLLTTCDQVAKVGAVRKRVAALDNAIVSNGAIIDADAWYVRIAFRTETIRAWTYGGLPPIDPLPVASPSPEGALLEQCNDAIIVKLDLRPAEATTMLQAARNAAGNNAGLAGLALTNLIATSRFLLSDLRQTRELLREQSSLALVQGSNEWVNAMYYTCLFNRKVAAKAYAQLSAYSRKFPAVWSELVSAVAAIASAKRATTAHSQSVISALRKVRPLAARRRLFFEVVFGARDIALHPTVRSKLARLLEMSGHETAAPRLRDQAAGLEIWMLNKWIAPETIGELVPLRVTDTLLMAKWYADTECEIRFAPFKDDISDTNGSEFARGLALFAAASAAFDAGDHARANTLAVRGRELLGAASMPLSVWLARTNILLCRIAAETTSVSETLLLTTEEMCERLDAEPELAVVRAMLNARRGASINSTLRPVVTLAITPELVAGLRNFASHITRAVDTDVTRSVSRRTPDSVIAELTTHFFPGIDDLSKLVPEPDKHSPVEARFAIVADHPTIAALPLELAVATAATLRYNKRKRSKAAHSAPITNFVAGWRTVDTPHESVNERWVLRVFDALGTTTEDGVATLDTLTRSFQSANGLPVTGTPDASTLKQMVRVLRGTEKTRVAIIIATTPPWSVSGGMLATRLYDHDLADVTTLSEGVAPSLSALQAKQFDVIHILAPVIESGSYGGLAFNLRPGSPHANAAPNVGGQQYLSLSEFIGTVKRSDSLLRPVLVVHNTLEEMPFEESIRQYCLRNIMTMELCRSGAPVASVGISTGLYNSDQSTASILASTLVSGAPLSQFIDRASQQIPTYESKHVTYRVGANNESAIVQELQVNASCVYATNPEYVVV